MRKYILIGSGGFLGAILRYLIKEIQLNSLWESIPINTLLINVMGSFVLALVLTATIEVSGFDEDIKVGATVGFLGAFTTFSTLCREIAELLYQGYYFRAGLYLILSAAMGIAAAYLGMITARKVIIKMVNQSKKDKDT